MTPYFTKSEEQAIFSSFVEKFSINDKQAQQFKQYLDLIIQENQKYNITAITGVREIILDHFYDSLALLSFCDMEKIQSLADVGSGGGLPGIPLAIIMALFPLALCRSARNGSPATTNATPPI